MEEKTTEIEMDSKLTSLVRLLVEKMTRLVGDVSNKEIIIKNNQVKIK